MPEARVVRDSPYPNSSYATFVSRPIHRPRCGVRATPMTCQSEEHQLNEEGKRWRPGWVSCGELSGCRVQLARGFDSQSYQWTCRPPRLDLNRLTRLGPIFPHIQPRALGRGFGPPYSVNSWLEPEPHGSISDHLDSPRDTAKTRICSLHWLVVARGPWGNVKTVDKGMG